jgi:hypothetical protein
MVDALGFGHHTSSDECIKLGDADADINCCFDSGEATASNRTLSGTVGQDGTMSRSRVCPPRSN